MGTPAFDGSQQGPQLGYFVYTVVDDHWWWSDGLYALHGYAPREVPASTEVMLAHKHPDDAARTYDVLETAVRTGEPFSCYHRVVDRQSRVRSVLSVGRGILATDGSVEQLTGFFIDLTEVRRAETEAEVESALVRIARNRAVIERAKGMVMLVTGCDEEEAFAVLRRHSQHANVKLSLLAHLLVDAVADGRLANDRARTDLNQVLADLAGSADELRTG
jgi:hypothetical protein